MRLTYGFVLATTIALAACGGPERAEPRASDLTWPAANTTVTTTKQPVSSEPTGQAVVLQEPAELTLLSDDQATADLPRTTAAGIRVDRQETTVDFGDGEEPVIEFSAEHPNSDVSLYLGPDLNGLSPSASIDSAGWASSNGTFVIAIMARGEVAEVVITSRVGNIDRAVPGEDGVAVLALFADEPSQMTIEGFDAEGVLVGRCATDSNDDFSFLECESI